MIWRLLMALVLGVAWVNLLVYYLFKSGYIYNYMSKKGIMREQFELGSKRWLAVLALAVTVYLVVSDLLVLGYNHHSLMTVFLLNLLVTGALLAYNTFVINGWLIPIQRPMVLNISKMLTPVTIRSYTRFTWFQGGTSSVFLSLIGAWIYRLLVSLAA